MLFAMGRLEPCRCRCDTFNARHDTSQLCARFKCCFSPTSVRYVIRTRAEFIRKCL
eukprot:COSAG02_NODE_68_length_42582_cov_52.351129_3_plen_56_part_00